jgi:BirA family biotin operon repressor/biotin-[acetyl-CoA-carboxylase] ligase
MPHLDEQRQPLQVDVVRAQVVGGSSLWRQLEVVDETASTNEDLRVLALAGAGDGHVLVAEHQHAGRGRLSRRWSAPPRSALTFSVLVRPPTPTPSPWGWLPLAAALAIADALRSLQIPDVGIKWPNDVLLEERKVAGVLCERVETATSVVVVVGIGLNVGMTAEELPIDGATSLALVGASTDREAALIALLGALDQRFRQWCVGDVNRLRADYLRESSTVGRDVIMEQAGQPAFLGLAEGIDVEGRLVVAGGSGTVAFAAADVVHARSAE